MYRIANLLLLIPFIGFGQWNQIGADIDGEAAQDRSGTSTAISGDGSIVAIGAPGNDANGTSSGHVRIYQNQGGIWSQLGQDLDGPVAIDNAGSNVDLNLSGSRVAFGAVFHSSNGTNSGLVRVYEYNGSNWVKLGQDILGLGQLDFFGRDVSLNDEGNILAVGAAEPQNSSGDDTDPGSVRIYEFNGSSWNQIGQEIVGENIGDLAGIEVAMNALGDQLVFSSVSNDENGTNAGQVSIYQNQGGSWVQIGNDINGVSAGDEFGGALSMNADGSIIAVGAYKSAVFGVETGQVKVFEYTSGTWEQVGQDLNGEAMGDLFGRGVSLTSNGNILAVGSLASDNNGVDSGHVRVFYNANGTWQQIDSDINGESPEDRSGISVGLSSDGHMLSIGAWLNDGNGSNSGQVRVYENNLLGFNDNTLGDKMIAVPNPAQDFSVLHLNKEYDHIDLRIHDSLGREVFRRNYSNTDQILLDTHSFNQGVFMLHLFNHEKATVIKLIKS